ncbi:MAG TPA: hypothetical protein ENK78_03460 [Thiothrix sp.]|nr:hypothetical protein [Thiothrix sp.]
MTVLIGRITLVFGLIVTLFGVAGGFGFLLLSDQQNLAKICFMSVPVGFLFLFVGLSTIVLFEPNRRVKKRDITPL